MSEHPGATEPHKNEAIERMIQALIGCGMSREEAAADIYRAFSKLWGNAITPTEQA